MGLIVTRHRHAFGPVLIAALTAVAIATPLAGIAAGSDSAVTGRVVFDVADGFATHRSSRVAMLETDNERFALTGVDEARLVPGSMVSVRGHRQDSEFAAASPPATFNSMRAQGIAPTSPRVAVLLVNFRLPSGGPPPVEPWTKSEVDELYFSGPRSVAAYYSEVSAGQISLTGDVFGYITLRTSTSQCDYGGWASRARNAAEAAGIDLRQYTNVTYAFPRQQSCWWSGMSTVPGRNNWVNGELTLYVASHELGHNFGLDHSAALLCRAAGVRVAYSSSCSLDEYGDPFDVMGYTGERHFHAWHRMQLGLLAPEEVQTVTDSGNYRIAPAEPGGGAPRLLRVPKSGGDFYYFEYRQPYGQFDDFGSSAAVTNGVTVRIAPDIAPARSKLIDTTPETTSFNDAPLRVGRTFAAPNGDVYGTVLSVDSTGADVFIQVGQDLISPTAPDDVQAAADESGRVKLTWSGSTDDALVTGYEVTRDGAALASTSGTSYVDSGLEGDRTYEYSVVALDRQNRSEPATVSVFVPVATAEPPPADEGDTTSPGAPPEISASVNGPRVGTVRWSEATDDVGVDHYRVFRNGLPYATTRELELNDVRIEEGVTYQFSVCAVDAAGNVGEATVVDFAVPDVTPPGQVFGLTASMTSESSARLRWQPAGDNVALLGYQVMRDGQLVATVLAGTRWFVDTGLPTDMTYRYTVVSVDRAGNVGRPGIASVSLHPVDRVAPDPVGTVAAEPLGNRRVRLTWAASTDDQPGPVTYRIYRGSRRIATVSGTTFVDRAPRQKTYLYRVRAVDASGNVSAFSSSIAVFAVRRLH